MNSPRSRKPVLTEEQLRDLGFGSVVARESRQRLLNRDGTFNVRRTGLGFWASLSLYQWLLTISWSRFFAILGFTYLLINGLFAVGYLLCGSNALVAHGTYAETHPFARAFFFSVQTFATIGYGGIIPDSAAANLVVTFESIIGLLTFALATGLLFSRFSRPTAHILFSRHAVIAPYRQIRAFEFRIANQRKNQIIELEAKVLFSRFESIEQSPDIRRFYPLALERERVTFFPLSWTLVHPIDEDSPLNGLTEEDFARSNAEFLILLTGIDETFSQTVHTRSSYVANEIIWNAKFGDVFRLPDKGEVEIDVGRIHEIERL